MPRDKTPADIERALARLMPVALSEHAVEEIEASLDQLSGEDRVKVSGNSTFWNWRMVGGVAAVLTAGIFAVASVSQDTPQSSRLSEADKSFEEPEMPDEEAEFVLLTETERVEEVHDEGLFIDSGGSTVRRVRVRMIGERQMRDEETGIVMKLTEPREETFMVPVRKF